jgi:glycosyltransferase involved in cell wall biosynthesis
MSLQHINYRHLLQIDKLLINHSIIVCTAGRAQYLESCLKQLDRLLPIGECETILVDNNQTELESIRVKNLAQKFRVKYIREPSPGLTAARHAGVMASSGDIVSFIDDDVLISQTWFQSLVEIFQNKSVVLAGGPSKSNFETSPPSWVFKTFKKELNAGFSCIWLSLLDLKFDVPNVDPMFIWGLNFNIRKHILLNLGGFNPDLVPAHYQEFQGDGESGLAWKIKSQNLRADYCQKLSVLHMIPNSRLKIDYVRTRAFYQGVGEAFTHLKLGITKSSNTLKFITGVLRLFLSLRKLSYGYTFFCIIWFYFDYKGYRWLIHKYRNRAEVQDWINKKHYFGVDISTFAGYDKL